jgi:hypothetical protein
LQRLGVSLSERIRRMRSRNLKEVGREISQMAARVGCSRGICP